MANKTIKVYLRSRGTLGGKHDYLITKIVGDITVGVNGKTYHADEALTEEQAKMLAEDRTYYEVTTTAITE